MRKTFYKIVISLAVGLEAAIYADVISAYASYWMPAWVFLAILLAAAVCVFLIIRRKKTALVTIIALLLMLILAIPFFSWKYFQHNARYADIGNFPDSAFSSKKALFIVPHQDDELNLAGGFFEKLLACDSEVYVIFVTNGDKNVSAESRLTDATGALNLAGIDNNHIILLGYGDGVMKNLYLESNGDKVYTAPSGRDRKYAVNGLFCFNEGDLYTRNNVIRDITGIIRELQPDFIFANDYDKHDDHEAVSLFVDEAVGKMLMSDSEFHPALYKSFTYPYTFYGYKDYYDSINIGSTRKTNEEPFLTETNVFSWSDRVRFPVDSKTLSRSLFSSDIYIQEISYLYQGGPEQAERVISGDRVFWNRSTKGIIYGADVSVSSGNGAVLNDFKLYDSDMFYEGDIIPQIGVWIPEKSESEKSATFSFDSPQDVELIELYDSPSLTDNVLKAVIEFDNGHSYEVGALKSNGSFTPVAMDEKGIKSFTVRIEQSEGVKAGLTEIEAYKDSRDAEVPLDYIKIQDGSGNFAYDYIVGTDGKGLFTIYSPNGDISADDCTVLCDGKKCSAELEDGTIVVDCPALSSCRVTVITKDGQTRDEINVSNPSVIYRLGWEIERFFYNNYLFLYRTFTHQLLDSIRNYI